MFDVSELDVAADICLTIVTLSTCRRCPREIKSMASGSDFLGATAKSSARRRTRTHVNTSAFEEDDDGDAWR